MKKSLLKSMVLIASLFTVLFLVGCNKGDDKADGKEEITMWFWGAEPYSQDALNELLVDKYNSSQDEYTLKVEYRNSVDEDINTALAANKGPDVVYGSGPSFVMPLVEAGKLASMEKYSKKYGWQERILDPIYDAGTVDGELYALANGVNTVGVFYNKKVLADNNWEVPETVDDMVKIMDEAVDKGMYASVTGNKGWKPVNENYASLFLTHFAGPENVYKALENDLKFDSPEITSAIDKSAEWYQEGYIGGKDYANLNFSESLQLLSDEESPFFMGPLLAFQWANSFFVDDKINDLGFMAFPATEQVPEETYTLSVPCTFSINANSDEKHQDEAAKIIDMMLQPEFMQEITEVWPGYWGLPLKDLSEIDASEMAPLSKSFVEAVEKISLSVDEGNFGYYTNVFFPPATQQVFVDIENVWLETQTSEELMKKADVEFGKEFEKGLVPPIPKPGKK